MKLATFVITVVACAGFFENVLSSKDEYCDSDCSKKVSSCGCRSRERLVKDLTKKYRSNVEPDKTSLKLGLAIQCVRFDEQSGVATTNAWEKYLWTDDRLVWDPKDYDGITTLRLPEETFWRPDVKLYNSLVADEERSKDSNVVVSSDGSVLWIPPVVYKTLCTSGGTNCQLRLGSWTFDADYLHLTKDGEGVDLTDYFNTTCPLVVDSVTAEVETKVYPCCKEPYASLVIDLKLKKRA